MCQNAAFVALVPYWAVWPFETMVLPRRHVQRMADLRADEQRHLADIMRQLTTRYDNLFQCNFPYSMGWHGELKRIGNDDSTLPNCLESWIMCIRLIFEGQEANTNTKALSRTDRS